MWCLKPESNWYLALFRRVLNPVQLHSGESGGDAESPTPVPRVQAENNRAILHPQNWLRDRESNSANAAYETAVNAPAQLSRN